MRPERRLSYRNGGRSTALPISHSGQKAINPKSLGTAFPRDMAESSASISVVNIYRIPLQESELREQLRKYYFFGNAVRDTNHAVLHVHRRLRSLSAFRDHS